MISILPRAALDTLVEPILTKWPTAAISIEILHHGAQQLENFGCAQSDSIYEVGSVTKTFTALALAFLVCDGTVRLDDPVRQYLDTSRFAFTGERAPEITLLDLATHHSGLARLPKNIKPKDKLNPNAEYSLDDMYEELRWMRLRRPTKPKYLYSNFGYAVLGAALSNAAGCSYAELVRTKICEPLGLTDTQLELTPSQQERFVQGYNAEGKPTPHWTFQAVAPAGALRSTAPDILQYLQAHVAPQGALCDAMRLVQQPRVTTANNVQMALAWHIVPNGALWHNGGTFGFSSFATFRAVSGVAYVVLVDRFDPRHPLADQLGMAVGQMLRGQTPAKIKV